MGALSFPRVIVVGGDGEESGGVPVSVHVDVSTGPVEVEVVNNQPIEVSLTEVANNLSFLVDGRGVANYFFDSDGNAIPIKTAFAAPASSGNNSIVSAVTDKKIRVIGYQLQGKGTVSAKFRSASTDKSMTWDFQAREGVVVPLTADGFYFETAVNEALNLNLSDAVGVNVQVQYIEVS